MISKESQVTIIFRIIKIMATTVGETAQPFLMINLDLDGYPYLEGEIKLSCGKPL
jgi:uncharacterized membrane-anchored protein